jgi:hypothetical protein
MKVMETKEQIEQAIRESFDRDSFGSDAEYERAVAITLAEAVAEQEEEEEKRDASAAQLAVFDRIHAALRRAGFVASFSGKSEATYWGFEGPAADNERIRVASHDPAYTCSESLVEIGVGDTVYECDEPIAWTASPEQIDQVVAAAIAKFHARITKRDE